MVKSLTELAFAILPAKVVMIIPTVGSNAESPSTKITEYAPEAIAHGINTKTHTIDAAHL